MIENTLLTPKRAIYNLLGAVCNQPSLLHKDGIELHEKDFEETFYKTLFLAINNMVLDNITISKITPVDIDNYLADNTKAYKIFEDNNGFEVITSAINNANVELFEQNLKKNNRPL